MSSTLLDATVAAPTSDLQRWRQFCFLATTPIDSPQMLLEAAVGPIAAGFNAPACVIAYDPPLGAALRAQHGTIDPRLELLISEVETRLLPGQLQPVSYHQAGWTVTSIPLLLGGRPAGVLHVATALRDDELNDLRLVAMMLSNALERQALDARAHQALRHTLNSYQALLQALARVLAEAPSLGDATPTILRSLCECLEWDLGIFWQADRRAGTLRLSTFWQRPDLEAEEFITFCTTTPHQRGIGLPGRVWAQGEPLWVADVVQDENFPGALLAAKQRLRSALAFPIQEGDHTRGVIALYRRAGGPPDQGTLALLAAVGSQIGQFVERRRAELALWEREQQYRATFEHAGVGIGHLSLEGYWLRFNRRLCDILGYSAEELTSRHSQALLHPEDRPRLQAQLQQLLTGAIDACSLEYRYRRRDGGVAWVSVTISLMRDQRGQPTFFIAVVEDIDARKRAEAAATRLTEELRQERDRLLRREIEVRTQIGRDLHDGPVQQVAVAALTTQYARRIARQAPERLDEALTELEQQLRRTTQDLRTVLYELRPLGIAEEGLVAVLRQYLSRLHDPEQPVFHLDAPSALRRLPPDHEAAIFIIVQEAINNVRKHAAARNVWIRLWDDGTALCATVRDDGRGFPVEDVQRNYVRRGSFGLLNMSERAQLLGGTCRIESRPGQGTTVHVRIPYTE